ncbi:MAG TPA: class I SAM-dependent methyltransferase [Anaerolineae bacterium]|nr:class I SAM-dependent methyltransferase [Anaerolineae bacterium]
MDETAKDSYQQSWQGRERAQKYEQRADLVLPKRQEMLSLIVQLIPFGRDEPLRVLDLGTGTGVPAQRVLQDFPRANVIGVDKSAEMMEIGCAKLAEYGDRARFVQADLEDPTWNNGLPDKFEAIVSALAFNLLTDEAKQRLFAQCYEMLEPHGCLVFSDRLRAADEAVDRFYLDQWMNFIVRRTREMLGKEVTLETVTARQRSLDEAAGVKSATLEDILTWLRQAGFVQVECYWKYFQWAVFGASKPGRSPTSAGRGPWHICWPRN